jgi:hypothetical protein
VICTPPPVAAEVINCPAKLARVSPPPVKVSADPFSATLNPARLASLMTILSPADKSAMMSPLRPAAVPRKMSEPAAPVR